jgi:type IV secretory pathway VirB2 component (pilin)
MYAHLQTLAVRLFAANTTGLANCGDGSGDCETNLPKVTATSTQLHQILQIVFGALAALSVLMIVIAGLRLVTAQGDTNEIAKARKTIIYSIVGLVIALSAEAFVALVLGKIA